MVFVSPPVSPPYPAWWCGMSSPASFFSKSSKSSNWKPNMFDMAWNVFLPLESLHLWVLWRINEFQSWLPLVRWTSIVQIVLLPKRRLRDANCLFIGGLGGNRPSIPLTRLAQPWPVSDATFQPASHRQHRWCGVEAISDLAVWRGRIDALTGIK